MQHQGLIHGFALGLSLLMSAASAQGQSSADILRGGRANRTAPSGPSAAQPQFPQTLPAQPTSVDQLVAVADSLNPGSGFLESFIRKRPPVRDANEFDRPALLAREASRLKAKARSEQVWIGFIIELDEYSTERGGFPVKSYQMMAPPGGDEVTVDLADRSPFMLLKATLDEGRRILSEGSEGRRFRVLARGDATAASISPPSQGGRARLLVKADAYTLWTVAKTSYNRPVVLKQEAFSVETLAGLNDRKPAQLRDAVRLDYTTLDLLMIKTAPEKVSDNLLAQMLLDRWLYEFRGGKPDVVGGIPADRFFSSGTPFPNESELKQILPTYRRWAEDAASKLPQTFHVVSSAINSFNGGFLCEMFYVDLFQSPNYNLPERLTGIVPAEEYKRFGEAVYSQHGLYGRGNFGGQAYSVGPVLMQMPSTRLSREDQRPRPDVCALNDQRALENYRRSLPPGAWAERLPIAVVEMPVFVASPETLAAYSVARSIGVITSVKLEIANRDQPVLRIQFRASEIDYLKIRDIDYKSREITIFKSFAPADGPIRMQ